MKNFLLILALLVFATATRADSIVFDTFGPGNSYNAVGGFGVGDFGGLVGFEEAAQFTAGASGNLTTVDLGLTYISDFAALPVDVYLYKNASGFPDTTNQTFLGSGTPTNTFGTNNTVV